ncbi:MAG: phosphohydrolase [Flavobacteriaceae bacterium]|nr:phosphohydrolase [Flavobacteriaceae bacterium]
MRSYSLFTIVLLCVAITILDTVAFFWLQDITRLLSSIFLRTSIHVLFWMFTFGLVTAILVLKIRMDRLKPKQRQRFISSMYGLTVSSFIPKFIFVIIISVFFFSNAVIAESESVVLIPLIGLVSGLLPFLVIVYAIFKGLYKFKVYHVPLQHTDLKGLRIVQISDLHLGSFNAKYHVFDRAVKMINELQPHLLFFTGDLVNNYAWELEGWEETFNKLEAKIGKFSVLGNHDYGDYSTWKSEEEKKANFNAIKNFQQRIGFTLLLNEAQVIFINNKKLAIVGVENWGSPPFKQYGDLQTALKDVKTITPKILLSHDPSHWKEEVTKRNDIFLTLSGHTHGMQAGVSLRGKEWSPIKYKYTYWAGLYEKEGQFLYVNRGLGWMGFPGRLGMWPEITCFDFE